MSKTFVDYYLGVSKYHGIGVFANQDVKSQSIIGIFTGEWYLLDMGEVEPIYPDFLNPWYCIDVAPMGDKILVLYLNEQQGVDIINHSNNPNCEVYGHTVYAIQDIPKGTEFTYDYRNLDCTQMVFKSNELQKRIKG